MTPTDDGANDQAENRLDDYLAEIREDAPKSDAAITRRVSRSARWQRALREPLLAASHLAGAVLEGIGAFLGTNRRVDR